MDAVRHTGHGPGRRRRRAAAAVGACALLATACASLHAGKPPAATHLAAAGAARSGDGRPEPARHYAQRPTWEPCEDEPSYECAVIEAPLDYAHPESGDITLAVTRLRSTGTPSERIGSLLYNPGGPGDSAVGGLREIAGDFSPAMRAAYDLVAVDPRGVGASTPLECGTTAPATVTGSRAFAGGKPDFEALDEAREETADACLRHSGRLLPHVGTSDAARDLDLVRALVGDDRLHYLGFSYGTYLGATYAGLFPSRVGRMVLDGAVDPTIEDYRRFLDPAHGYQVAWEAFAADCVSRPGCPVGRSAAEAGRVLDALVARLDRNPRREGKDAALTGEDLLRIVLTALKRPAWGELRLALGEVVASAGDSAALQRLSAAQEDAVADVGFTAVSCLSAALGPVFTPAQAEALVPAFRRASPQFGAYYSALLTTCAHWPVGPVRPSRAFPAPPTAPILVVGTLRDPATPYSWAQALTRLFPSARLLTWDGDGHTAYLQPGSACVDAVVDRYLLGGGLPPAGTVCP
ncbi:alpha/beta hydrolase [Actinacidiphila glaucinigra]|uniref:alpha/beta hydrolase n=1 Tax=Actinacidiphila glaucinigra TaxID=235986 RepID=UPI0037B56603